MKTYIGLDIGKKEIFYAYPPENGVEKTGKFANTEVGRTHFVQHLCPDTHCVLEATGLYHFPLAYALQEAGIALTIINPSVSSAYAKSLSSISKTDKSDAALLQRLGQERQLEALQLPTKSWQSFRHKLLHLQNLKKDIGQINNRQKALNYHPSPDPLACQMIATQRELLEQQLQTMEEAIEKQLPSTYQADLKFGASVKGIGKKTALFLLSFTRGLEDFKTPKALAKYIGIAPTIYQSGKYQKRGRIQKKGNAILRSLLYNCAKSARRFNRACKALYDKLRAKGKSHKVAMVAVMHKLVRQFFACIKNKTTFQDNYAQKG